MPQGKGAGEDLQTIPRLQAAPPGESLAGSLPPTTRAHVLPRAPTLRPHLHSQVKSQAFQTQKNFVAALVVSYFCF